MKFRSSSEESGSIPPGVYQIGSSNGNAFFFFVKIFCVFFGLMLQGCASYKISTRELFRQEDFNFETEHWLYQIVPRHRSQIQWYDLGHWLTWTFMGNDDAGIFGERESYLKSKPASLGKAIRWTLRNPCHNFCFYVIGNANQINSEVTFLNISSHHCEILTYSPVAKTDFADEGTSLFFGLHGWKPFISLRISYGERNDSAYYFGWRKRGNFGIKFIPLKKKKGTKQLTFYPEKANNEEALESK